MPEKISITCQAFRKNDDDSWTSVQIIDVSTPIGIIRISAGMTFRKGRTLNGYDIATLLEQNCR